MIRLSAVKESRGREDRYKETTMQIRKTYQGLKPELMYDEIRDFVLKQGTVIGETKMGTYSLPNDSSSFISRGTLTFKIQTRAGGTEKECVRAHIVGEARAETKLMLDIDESLFPQPKIASLQEDLDFFFASYEVKHH